MIAAHMQREITLASKNAIQKSEKSGKSGIVEPAMAISTLTLSRTE